ncbi:MAG TPA: helix-turn-helix transcriptional regulator [Acidimicrobiales bacterium]|nr:helix-turn-helix transcriptional regulator [Acidimicrobiales bacterium]
MATPESPTASRRWLASELRRLREARGLAQKDAARECGWSGARLSYLETSQRPVTDDDLDKLLPLYDLPEADREPLYAAVRKAQEEGWWERFEHLVGAWLPIYVGLEQGAAAIRSYEPLLVPGILQTEEYCRAIMSGGLRRRSRREIDRLVELRTTRKAILTREEEPTKLDAVIDEGVLLRSPVEPGVLAPQLEHLAEMATLPNVTVRVVPFERGVHSFSTGPFSILSFPLNRPDPVVYLEHIDEGLWLEDFDAIERYALAFDGLADLALDREASLATMRETAERHARID